MNNRKYTFSPPYNRDSRLVIRPFFKTTHEITYPYPNRGRYIRIKSRYKQQPPFVNNVKTAFEITNGVKLRI